MLKAMVGYPKKTTNPRMAMTMAGKDCANLVRFCKFLESTFPILKKQVMQIS